MSKRYEPPDYLHSGAKAALLFPDCPKALRKEPKCEDCGAGVSRPKCLVELGGGCPRHETKAQWEADILAWARARVENLDGGGI